MNTLPLIAVVGNCWVLGFVVFAVLQSLFDYHIQFTSSPLLKFCLWHSKGHQFQSVYIPVASHPALYVLRSFLPVCHQLLLLPVMKCRYVLYRVVGDSFPSAQSMASSSCRNNCDIRNACRLVCSEGTHNHLGYTSIQRTVVSCQKLELCGFQILF